MSAMHEGETLKAVRVECWGCNREFFVPFEDRGEPSRCPYCGNRSKDMGGDGLATQGRSFEVSA